MGLLFVSLSFHLDALLHDTRAHLLAHARATLVAFTYVLTVSLVFLIPHQSARRLGVTIAGTSLVLLVVSVTGLIRSRGRSDSSGHARFMIRRRRIAIAAYFGAVAAGAALAATHDLEYFYAMIAVVCALLGNAAGSAWDLLVQVGRIRRDAAEPDRR